MAEKQDKSQKDGIDPLPVDTRESSIHEGDIEKLDDKENREFYGHSVSDSYRLKSELISKCFEEIGMGR
jgi:hypothetical protein